jgi:hypothetical protein
MKLAGVINDLKYHPTGYEGKLDYQPVGRSTGPKNGCLFLLPRNIISFATRQFTANTAKGS